MDELRRKFSAVFDRKQNNLTGEPAWLGDDAGNVQVSGRANYVYARTMQHKILEVYNRRVGNVAGLAVLIGYDPLEPQLLQVLSQRNQSRHGEDAQSVAGAQPSHHYQHEWMSTGPNGGSDPVFVQLRQLMPFRVGPAGGMTIAVHRGVLFAGGQWRLIEPAASYDLVSYRVNAASSARWVLVTLDSTGTVTFTAGNVINWTSLTYADIPSAPAGTAMTLAAIRLYTGQTEIREARSATDILDCRFPAMLGDAAQSGIIIDSLTGETVTDAVTSEVVYG